MSAFVVSNKHITAILLAYNRARIASRNEIGHTTSDVLTELRRMGDVLLAENVRSVNHRYREDDLHPPFEFDKSAALNLPTPIAAIKLVHSLEYQSCECDDWETTEAYRLCNTIKDAIITSLPEWNAPKAEWAI